MKCAYSQTIEIEENKELEALDEISKKLTMYDRFYSLSNYTNDIKPIREALIRKQKLEKAIETIKEHKLLNYVFKNKKCSDAYHLNDLELEFLKEVFGNE